MVGPFSIFEPGVVGFAKTFNGDVLQRPVIDFGSASIYIKKWIKQVIAQLLVKVHYFLAH